LLVSGGAFDAMPPYLPSLEMVRKKSSAAWDRRNSAALVLQPDFGRLASNSAK
jgi:hypothetical protein